MQGCSTSLTRQYDKVESKAIHLFWHILQCKVNILEFYDNRLQLRWVNILNISSEETSGELIAWLYLLKFKSTERLVYENLTHNSQHYKQTIYKVYKQFLCTYTLYIKTR